MHLMPSIKPKKSQNNNISLGWREWVYLPQHKNFAIKAKIDTGARSSAIHATHIKEYVKNNPKCVLLDVRTEEEWNSDGKPSGEKIGIKTCFLTIQFADKSFNQNFEEEFKKLNIDEENEILTMCMGGVRSQAAAELIEKKNF